MKRAKIQSFLIYLSLTWGLAVLLIFLLGVAGVLSGPLVKKSIAIGFWIFAIASAILLYSLSGAKDEPNE